MNMNLPDDMESFVKKLVSQGTFDTEQAAVVEGIRLLMVREKLRGEIQIGIEQLDGGKWLDEEAVFEEVNSDIDHIESTRRES